MSELRDELQQKDVKDLQEHLLANPLKTSVIPLSRALTSYQLKPMMFWKQSKKALFSTATNSQQSLSQAYPH